MRLEDLKGLKKNDKYRLLKQQDNIDDLGEDVIRKLSNDIAINVREEVASRTNNVDIILEMIYNKKKNWKSGNIMNKLLSRDIIPEKDRMDFIESRVWEDPAFPFNSVKHIMAKGLFMHKKGNGFVPLIIKMAKEKPLPYELIKDAQWDATKDELIELISLTTTHIYGIFDSAPMQDKLPIKIFKDLALKKLSSNLNVQQLSKFFFSKVLDDELYNHLFKNTENLITTSYEKRKAVFKNKNLSYKTFEDIFYQYIDSDKILGSFRDYFLLLSNCPLNKKMNGEIQDFIKHISDTQNNSSDIPYNMVCAYAENPTADKKIIKALRETYKGGDQSKIIAAINKNPSYSDNEVEAIIDNTLKETSNNKELGILLLFNNIMKDSSTPPRQDLINKVWNIIISKEGFEFHTNKIARGPVYDALVAFFTNGARGNFGQKNTLPKQIQVDKGVEYFKKKGIADWVVYDDSISLKDLEDIWDSDYIKNANMKLDKYGSQTGSRATKLKYDILNGKYKEHFGTLYYEESGDESFLPETVKDIFIF